jgi:hypothetical protein
MCDYSLHHVKSRSARVGDNGHRDFNSVTSRMLKTRFCDLSFLKIHSGLGVASSGRAGQQKSRRSAGTNVLPGRRRWCDRPWLCDARKEQNALHTLIHQRRLTPCGGLAPTAERTLDPARIFTESLTPRPELENSLGQSRSFGDVCSMSGLPESGSRCAILRCRTSANTGCEHTQRIG